MPKKSATTTTYSYSLRGIKEVFATVLDVDVDDITVTYKLAEKASTSRYVDPRDNNNYTLVIAVGGDGTMLEAMRLAHKFNATATGINLGNIGFLTDFQNDVYLTTSIQHAIHADDLPMEERVVLA